MYLPTALSLPFWNIPPSKIPLRKSSPPLTHHGTASLMETWESLVTSDFSHLIIIARWKHLHGNDHPNTCPEDYLSGRLFFFSQRKWIYLIYYFWYLGYNELGILVGVDHRVTSDDYEIDEIHNGTMMGTRSVEEMETQFKRQAI